MELDYCHNNNFNETDYLKYCNNTVCSDYCQFTISVLLSLVFLLYIFICCESCYILYKPVQKNDEKERLIVEGNEVKLYNNKPPNYEEV
tara:strand:- start:160 stop:426 length:267 start_codon:yes stop_codon:yes gene_type:complete